MNPQTILIVEDERSILDALVYNLQKDGFEVLTATDGRDGLRRAQSSIPDLIVLDLMLPVLNGTEVCKQLRADSRTKGIRILMLTAKSEEIDEIVGFSVGADDYVTKPFKMKPLISRVKAMLRRDSPAEDAEHFVSSRGVCVDQKNHRATLNKKELLLTPTEFNILWTLIRQPGRPFSRNDLLDTCRGEDANALERTIDVHIRSLRQKLSEQANLIETVRGIGYRFQSE